MDIFRYSPTSLELMFWQTLALIAVACFLAPLFKRLGLGSILGYLVAGLSINLLFSGNFSDHPDELLHFSEFGVVLFLFVIGLELKPQTLWRMRGDIFGLGTAQMMGCGAALMLAAMVFDLPYTVSLVIGLGLALSSTAIVMSQLDESRERNTVYGRKAFGILLLQDLAIVPLLLLVSLLASASDYPGFQQTVISLGAVLGAIVFLILVGRYLLDRMFVLLARAGMQEIMTAGALGVVIAAALLMDMVGMSYALGSFLAGVLLAESSFRHEVEANIEPFRGLFLGLFFMAVGLSLNLGALVQYWYVILALAPCTMLVKSLCIYGITRIYHCEHNTAVKVALALSQHGEFGFVLFGSAAAVGLFPETLASILIAVVAISMALSSLTTHLEPLLLDRSKSLAAAGEDASELAGRVLIIGFSRFGQIVSQPLLARGMNVTILDHNIDRIHHARQLGFRVHYGDGTRRDILRMVGVDTMDAVVVCAGSDEARMRIHAEIKAYKPGTAVYVRAGERDHALKLFEMNPEFKLRETLESALLLGEQILVGLGAEAAAAAEIIAYIRKKGLNRLRAQLEEGLHAGKVNLYTHPVSPDSM